MKPGLAVLPLEVWADIFLSPWITRQELARFANKIRNRKFAEKLQKLLHGCGKHSLHVLAISCKHKLKYALQRKIVREYQASLAIVHYSRSFQCVTAIQRSYKFPKTEMPENIKDFKYISIRYLDDQVLDFLHKIKPLFINVQLNILGSMHSAENMRTLLDHLLPMVGGIRRICCDKNYMELLELHFPGTMALAKELNLSANACCTTADIPPCLNWLIAPQDFYQHGPRFLTMHAHSNTIIAMINTVRKQFSAATTPFTFVVFLEFHSAAEEHNNRADEFNIQNVATNEQLTVRNAHFKVPVFYRREHTHWYVEILRHPIGADAEMREWIGERAYYEQKYKNIQHDEVERVISVGGSDQPPLSIGQITKKAGPVNRNNDQPEDVDEDEAEPSTSAKKMKK